MQVTAYMALRPFKFAGRQYDTGDPVPRAAILDVSGEKEGTLLRTRFIGLPPERRDITRATKQELLEFAGTLGVDCDRTWRKADLIEAIERATV